MFCICAITLILNACISKQVADKNVTAKELNCHDTKGDPALIMFCCIQLMTPGAGNDSKDIMCVDLERETAEWLRQVRKANLYDKCFLQSGLTELQAQSCWDKLHTK